MPKNFQHKFNFHFFAVFLNEISIQPGSRAEIFDNTAFVGFDSGVQKRFFFTVCFVPSRTNRQSISTVD